MKKNKQKLANTIMVVVIALMILGGVLFAGNTLGWFDKPDTQISMLQEIRGLVQLHRDGISYTVEKPLNLRKGDVLTCESGSTAVITVGSSTLTIGEQARLTIEDPAAAAFSAEISQGEAFANCTDPLWLTMEGNRVELAKTIAHISVRKGAQTVSVFSGNVLDAAAGEKIEYLDGAATVGKLQIESLNNFAIAQLRAANQQSSTFFSDAQLDQLVADRNQALQDAINGILPGGTTDSDSTQSGGSTDADQLNHTHVYDVAVVIPTCTVDGYTKYTCICGDTYTDKKTNAPGHSWGDWITVKQPTSAAEGMQKHTCIRCDAFEEKSIAKLPAVHTHSYTKKVVSATCTTGGYTLHTCSCGVSYKDSETAATGHKYTDKIVSATCTVGGYTQHTCVCGDTYTDQAVAALGHTWGSWEIVKKPSTSQTGLQKRTCTTCKTAEEQTLPTLEFVPAGYVYLTIRCDTILNNMGDLNPAKAEFVPADGVILPQVKVAFAAGESAFDVLVRVCRATKIQLEYSWVPIYNTYYIEGINHLYEFDCGGESGWMYQVNGWFPNYGVSGYSLKDGDAIAFLYTCKGLGTDVGAPKWED